MFEHLEPKQVIYYFEKISDIPRASGNTKQVAEYILEEGKRLQCKGEMDDAGNVILYKNASEGYENAPVIMLQCHMDMVAQKTSGSLHDFSKDPIEILYDEETEIFTAKDTTLGADDGFGIAYILSILSDNTLKHPALECVFTMDEEPGLIGAAKLDLSSSKARYLINLDIEREGKFIVGCAGGGHLNMYLPVKKVKNAGTLYAIKLASSGGHSGTCIHLERPNTNKVAGHLLDDLKDENPDLKLISISGGRLQNAIPAETTINILSNGAVEFAHLKERYEKEYEDRDAKLSVEIKSVSEGVYETYDEETFSKILFFLRELPCGVQTMNHAIPGLVETSANLGIIEEKNGEMMFTASVRSSFDHKKERILKQMEKLCGMVGLRTELLGLFSGWAYQKDSKLRELCIGTWENEFADEGKKAEIVVTHAGLECGLLISKKPGLDAISMGPNGANAHTMNENLSRKSLEKVYKYLLRILEKSIDL